MFMVVRKNTTRVRKVSDKSPNDYLDQDISENVSLSILEVEDYDETETTKHNLIYYVFDGLLHLNVNGKESILQKGDAFFVERGMTFQMKGTFKAMSVNQPAFGVE